MITTHPTDGGLEALQVRARDGLRRGDDSAARELLRVAGIADPTRIEIAGTPINVNASWLPLVDMGVCGLSGLSYRAPRKVLLRLAETSIVVQVGWDADSHATYSHHLLRQIVKHAHELGVPRGELELTAEIVRARIGEPALSPFAIQFAYTFPGLVRQTMRGPLDAQVTPNELARHALVLLTEAHPDLALIASYIRRAIVKSSRLACNDLQADLAYVKKLIAAQARDLLCLLLDTLP